MANKQMNFSVGIKTTYDAAGINQLKADLNSLSKIQPGSYLATNTNEIQEAVRSANALKTALSQAYNPKLGTSTINRFNQSLKQSNITTKEIQAGLHKFGTQGDIAFLNATTSLLKLNTVARNTNTVLDKMFVTLKNTITWGLSSAVWNNVTGSIQKTYYYIKDLDTALNDIRIVTSKSNEEMAQFAKNANEAAKALGTSTRNYAEGSLIYYQQGLSDEEVKTRTDITAKTSMVTGQSMDQTSEQLTAVWNGYKASAEEAELYVDRLAAVAATTASDLEELSVGMSKVASSAANLGVTESQLSAILATTISVTRQAPESVGTAYKTIFARISDIKAGLDTETTFGNYTSKMAEMGISVLDTTGNLRDMGEVIEEIGAKWQTMTREQQISLAQTMAGTRQYNNLVALFDNWGNYVETLNTAENAAGTLAKQHNIALDSINNRLNILKATWEDLYQNLISSDDIKDIITALTEFSQVIADIVKSVGGLKTILPAVTSLFLQLGSNTIAKELGVYVNNFLRINQEAKELKDNIAVFSEVKNSLGITTNEDGSLKTSRAQEQELNKIAQYYEEMIGYKKVMSAQDEASYNMILKQKQEAGALAIQIEKIKENSNFAQKGEFQNIYGGNKDVYEFLATSKGNSFEFLDNLKSENITGLQELSEQFQVINRELDNYTTSIKTAENSSDEAMNTINMVIKEAGSELGLNQQQIDQLAEKYNKLYTDMNGDGVAAFNAFKKFLTDSSNLTSNLANNMNNYAETTKIAAANQKQLRETLDVKAIIDDVTKLAGVLSSVGMIVSQISSLTKTWQDDSLSTSEKVLRTLTAIGFILPSILKSYQTIHGFLESFSKLQLAIKTSEGLTNENISKRELLLKGVLATEKQITAEKRKQELLDAKNNAAKELEEAKRELAGLEKVANSTPSKKHTNKVQKVKDAKKALPGVEAKVAEKQEAFNNATKAVAENEGAAASGAPGLIGLISSAPQAAAAIAAVVAVLAALVATVAIVKEVQKRATQESLKELKALKEKTDAREKEVQQLNELRDSYTSLKSQLDKNEITEIEYRNQVLALTKDIEDQTIKLQLLRGEYEELGQTMQEIAKQKNESLIADYEQEIKKSDATMQAAAVQGTDAGQWIWKSILNRTGLDWWSLLELPTAGLAGAIGNTVKGIDNKKKGITNQVIAKSIDPTATAELTKYFEENMSELIDTRGPGGYKLSIKTDSEGLIEAYEKIDKAIQDNAHLANTGTIKELTTIRDNMQEAYEIQKEAQNKMTELKKENLVYDIVDEKSLTSAKNYYDQVEKLAQAALEDGIFEGDDAYNKARIWANTVLSGISEETAQWSKDVGLIDSIIYNSNLSEADQKMLTSILEEGMYSDAQLKYLEDRAYTLGLSLAGKTAEGMKQGLEENLKEGENVISLYEKQAEKQKIASAIGLASQYKTFNNKEGQKLLKDTSLNTEEFRQSNYANQMIQAMDALASEDLGLTEPEIKALKDNTQKQIDAINEDINNTVSEAVNENKDKIFKQQLLGATRIEDNGDKTSMFMTREGESVGTQEEVNKALTDFVKGEEFLDDADKKIIENLKEKKILDEEQLIKLREENEEVPRLVKNLNDYENKLSSIQEQEINHVKNREDLINLSNEMSSATDDIQSAYKALSTATKEWNLNEGLSIDTVQDLLKMNPQYLGSLEESGGMLTVNTEKLNEYAKAEMHAAVNARAKADAELFAQLVDKDTVDTAYQEIMMLENLTGIQENYNDVIWESARAKLAEAKANGNLSDTEYRLAEAKLNTLQKGYGYQHQMVDKIDITKDTKKSSGKSSKKDEKNYRDDFDRYWEFLKAIDKVAEAIDKLEKKEKNLFGKEKISSLRTKNNLLKLQVKTYNDLFEEQKREQSELMGTLGSKGMTFNAEGEITNYAHKTSEALAAYNEAVRKYNAGMLSEEAFKVQEKAYEDFKKEVERYDKLYYSEMKDTLEKIEDIRRQVLANNLEAWEIEIKLKVDWGSLEREWADFLHNIEKDFTAVYEDLGSELGTILEKANTYSGDEGIISVDLKAIQDVMTEIDKLKAGGESDMFESISQAQEKLKELNSSLMKDSTDLKKLWEEAYKAYLQGIDQLNDKLEDQMEKYEQIDKELAHQQKLIGLLYGDDAYSMMDTLYKNQEKNQLAEISSLKTQKDLWEDKWKAAEEGSQEQLKYYNLMIEAQNNLNASVEDYVELLQRDLANAVRQTVDALDKSVTNGLGIDKVREQWDDLQDYNDGYFDENQRIFEIEKFGLTVEQKMADASAKTQKALKAFQEEELERLKKKEDLNEYDIKAAEYRLQLKEKELALEDAQNAKNSMKVTRDTNGNWTYQYVADEEDVANKQLDLIKATEDYYNFAKETHQKSLEDMMDLQEWYKEAIIEISTDMTLTQEEKEKRMQEATEKYERHAERLMAEANITAQDMAATAAYGIEQSINTSLIAMEDLTARQKEIVEQVVADNITDFQNLYKAVEDNNNNIRTNIEEMLGDTVPEWQTAAQDMADAWNADDGASIKSMVTDAIDEILNYLDDYEDKLDELQDTAGMDFDDIIYNINEATDATEDLKDMIEELCNDNDLDDLKDIVDDLADSWDDVKDSIVRAIDKIKEYLRLMGQAQNASVNLNTPSAGNGSPTGGPGGNTGGNGGSNPNGGSTQYGTEGDWWLIDSQGNVWIGKDNKGFAQTSKSISNNTAAKMEWAKHYGGLSFASKSDLTNMKTEELSKLAYGYSITDENLAKIYHMSKSDLADMILKRKQSKMGDYLGFATGGYTGDWAGGDGRLAVLHSKELVLNQVDTENFLSAVGMIRQIASFGTSIEDSIAAGLNSFMSRFSDSAYGLTRNETTNNTKQNIFNINAPITSTAATDEIQMAILQLPNLASQYVSRNNI